MQTLPNPTILLKISNFKLHDIKTKIKEGFKYGMIKFQTKSEHDGHEV